MPNFICNDNLITLLLVGKVCVYLHATFHIQNRWHTFNTNLKIQNYEKSNNRHCTYSFHDSL